MVESAAAEVAAIYQRHALAWSRDRGGRFLERAWCDRFLALLGAQHRAVLDVGCGTGKPIAQHLIERGCQVCGVDSSSAMITMCANQFPDHQWIVADMRALDLGRTFNGIVAWSSFFHLTPHDQRAMFSVFRRHAASGALLMFTSGPSAGEGYGRLQGEPLYTASLDSAEYRALLDEHGFDVITHVVEDPACGKQTVWLAQLRA
jgi:ubiquinone/menaquinone biosynthesis C-methylase UbiE